VLITGADHVEVGSSLRSVAAFGYKEVFLEDRGAGWFHGEHHQRREARAAARRHKNPLRVRRAPARLHERFDDVLVLIPFGAGVPIGRARLTRGRAQLIVIGATPDTAQSLAVAGAGCITLRLNQQAGHEPALRLIASIALAEIARQVGQPATKRTAPPPRGPRYQRELSLEADGQLLLVEHEELVLLGQSALAFDQLPSDKCGRASAHRPRRGDRTRISAILGTSPRCARKARTPPAIASVL
jgi:hypothetical protein